MTPQAESTEGTARLIVARDGTEVAGHVRIARSPWARIKGLLGTAELPAGHGLAFRRASMIHTVGMRYPIDVVFCDAELVVQKTVGSLAPGRIAGARGARWTFELPAGAGSALRRGDRLTLESLD